jgi:cell wall-associated NlpC family hydrolase
VRLLVLAAAALSVLAVLSPTSQAAPRGGHIHAIPRSVALTKAAPATWDLELDQRVVARPGQARRTRPSRDRHRSAPKGQRPRHFVRKRTRHSNLRHRRTLGQRAVRIARRLLGVPYRWGGASPSTGFDCSGLVQYVYGKLGFHLPHYTIGQFRYGRRVHRRRLRPGDLLFFAGLSHVGLYVGRGRFIDAPHSGAVVRVNSLATSASSFVGARRLGR